MHVRHLLIPALILLVLTTTGCFDQVKQAKEAAETISKAAEGLASGDTSGVEDAVSAAQRLLGGGEKVQPVDFRELRELLPETLPGGLTRTDASGQRESTMGISTSKVTGTYEGEGSPRPRVRITITDLGSMRGVGKFANNFEVAVDKEDSQGYERTTEYQGYKATEKFRDTGNYQDGSMSVLVEERFAVEVDGDNVPMETIKASLDRLNVDNLAAMKDRGVGEDDGSSERIAERINEASRQAREYAEEEARRQTESGPNAPAAPLTGPDAGNEASPAPREAVDFRELKALLPEQAAALARTSHEGQTQKMGEITVSSAEATYEEEGGQGRMTITITDVPAGGGIAMMGASWMMMEMERESDTGYERTVEYQGMPAYEKFQRNGDRTSAEKQVAVDRRYLIKVEGRNVEMEAVEALLDQVNLSTLQRLGQPSS
ncbi:MAG: hypothetical protein GVY18_07065 [Bacteroidetes bacterium]|jgi:hypothetical protein|nr:hypothetical protein [Bacteroidota bacterium]